MTPLAQPIPLATAGLPMMVVWAVVLIGMFMLLRRPAKRQQELQRQMQDSMQPGSRVMLSSGLFGTITHIGDKQAIVELAPGLEVTVLRRVLAKVVTPDEEEFEFADQVDEEATDEAAGDALDDGSAADVVPASTSYASGAHPADSTAPMAQAPSTESWAGTQTTTGTAQTDRPESDGAAAPAWRPDDPSADNRSH